MTKSWMTPNSLKISLGLYAVFFILLIFFPAQLQSLLFLKILIIHAHLIWIAYLIFHSLPRLRLKGRDALIIVFLILLSVTVRVMYSGSIDPYHSSAVGEQDAAESIFSGIPPFSTYGYSALLTYPLIFAHPSTALFHHLNIILASLAGIAVYLFFRDLAASRVVGTGMAGLFLLERHFLYWSGTGNSTSMLILFFALSVFFLHRSVQKVSTKSSWADAPFLAILFFIPNIRVDGLVLILPLLGFFMIVKKKVPFTYGLLLLPAFAFLFLGSIYLDGGYFVGLTHDGGASGVIRALTMEYQNISIVPGIIFICILVLGTILGWRQGWQWFAAVWVFWTVAFYYVTIGTPGLGSIFDEYTPRRVFSFVIAFGISLWSIIRVFGRWKDHAAVPIFCALVMIQVFSLSLVHIDHAQAIYEEGVTRDIVAAAEKIGPEGVILTHPVGKHIGSLINRLPHPPVIADPSHLPNDSLYVIEPEFCWDERISPFIIEEMDQCDEQRVGLSRVFIEEIGYVRIYSATIE